MELGPLPPRARLTWLVGPPGAGKTTFAAGEHGFRRVVELNAMLAPLVQPARIRTGVLEANGRLVQLIRALEHRPENLALPDLLVVGGLVPEDALFPLAQDELVWLLRPERARWSEQLHRRPAGGTLRQYDDFGYSEQWFDRFEDWRGKSGVVELEVPFRTDLLGRVVT